MRITYYRCKPSREGEKEATIGSVTIIITGILISIFIPYGIKFIFKIIMEMMKMTTWFIVTLFIFGAIKVLVSSMPTSVVESIISRFELHQKLEEENTSISIDGKNIEGEMKRQVIHEFNEALFLDKHYFPPHGEGTPLVIDTKKGNKEIRFSLYSHEEHVDVIKQYKKKIIAYRLRSKSLQNPTSLAITEEYA